MSKNEELDIPIKSITMQLGLGICMQCGKRKAKYLCDYITGKTFDLHGKGQIKKSTCDKYLCEKCTNKLNKRDYCRELQQRDLYGSYMDSCRQHKNDRT